MTLSANNIGLTHEKSPYYFQINLTSPSCFCYGFITLDGNKVFRIIDIPGFYAALGFTAEIRREGIYEEEYLWREFRRKDHSNKSIICLQLKIIDYISRHSATFKEEYAEQCAYWIDCCNEHRLIESPMCIGCKMEDS